MSAEVTIFADESAEPVLVVPVQAVLGTISSGAQRKCFVVGSNGQPVIRDIVVGMSNERLVEVKPWDEATQSGLKEGDQVVMNPQPLLKEDSELKAGQSRGKGPEGQQMPGGGKGPPGGGGKGAPGGDGKKGGAPKGKKPPAKGPVAFLGERRGVSPP
jgi:hypothetical protein